ncbi:MAG TPA: dihydrolipoamide acetyltransferase family protein [Anaerolineales bacterium]|nr:dihydrolipoamide acetyltransferase family protein [Anaerolineales bacterium]
MAKEVVMPALGMAQETGTLIQWLKAAGDQVTKGEPLMEVETDKATVEIEAPASGILVSVTAQAGDVIPVGQRIALILAPSEAESSLPAQPLPAPAPQSGSMLTRVTATPVAARLAAEHNLDITQVKPQGGQVRKEDVLAFIKDGDQLSAFSVQPSRVLASPKARRLAQERGLDLKTLSGSGPDGAVLAADILSLRAERSAVEAPTAETITVTRTWRVMVDRLSQAWTTIPHFYLIREVNASRLVAWREKIQSNSAEKITYTDLLVKLTAAALRQYPRLNASWQKENILLNSEINIGLAVAVEDGLIVPVIHRADELSLTQLAARRSELVARAQAGKLSLDDLSGGTFTISNLGMYGVDAFNAIVNPPQAAILAVSRIADRVVPVHGQPAVQPMITFSLSCDHRVVDGARGAEFLQALADLVEEPLQLLN